MPCDRNWVHELLTVFITQLLFFLLPACPNRVSTYYEITIISWALITIMIVCCCYCRYSSNFALSFSFLSLRSHWLLISHGLFNYYITAAVWCCYYYWYYYCFDNNTQPTMTTTTSAVENIWTLFFLYHPFFASFSLIFFYYFTSSTCVYIFIFLIIHEWVIWNACK